MVVATYIAQTAKIPIMMAMAATSQLSFAAKASILTKALLAQAAAWAATPIGMITIAAGAIFGLVSAVKSSTKAFEEQQQIVSGLKSDIESLTSEYTKLFDKTNRTDEENQKLKILEAQLEAKKALLAIEAKEAYKKYWQSTGRNKVGEADSYKNQIEKDNEALSNLDRGDYSNDAKGASKFLAESEKIQKRIESNKENLARTVSDMAEEYDLLQDILDTNGKFDDDIQAQRYDELSIAIDGAKEALGGLNEELKNTKNESNALASLSETFKSLSGAKDDISNLSAAYKQLSKDGGVGFDTLSKIQESFKDVNGIETYIDALARAKNNTQETANILSELTYSALEKAIGSTEQLANTNEALVASMLKENGVLNANEIATYAVASAKEKLALSSAYASGGIGGLIGYLNSASGASGVTKNSLVQLAAQIIATGSTGLNLEQQCSELSRLASYAYGASSAMATVLSGASVSSYMQKYRVSADTARTALIKESLNGFKNVSSGAPAPTFSGGGGGGGGGGGKKVEEYIAEIDKLYEATKRLEDIKYEIERLEVKSSITDDQQEQIENLNKIVLLYREQQKALAEIGELRRADIRENIKELEAKGFEIEYDATSNNLLIKNLENINKITGKNKEETNELRKKYEDLISETEKLNDANRDASKEWWNLEQKLKNISKEYSDIISSVKDVYKSTIDAILKVIDKEKEALEIQKEIFENQKSDLETTVDTVVSFIDKQIEALQKENDELDRQIEAQKKLEEIERAKNQRGHRIFREGLGYEYEADQSAVNKAQQEYDDYKRKKDLEDKVQALEDYKKLWQDVVDGYQRGINEQITADILGANWQKDILAQKTTNIQEYANRYNHVSNQLNEKTVGSVAYQIKQLDELSKQWGDAYDEIEDAISDHKINLDVLKDFEKGNYNQRLTLLKGYVSEAVNEINKLKAAQAAAEAAAGIGGMYQVQSDGNAQAGLKVGDKVNTAGGVYQIVSPNTPGANYNPASGYWSVKAYSSGGVADYTGMAMLHGGSAAELILNNADVGKLYEYIHDSPSIIQDMISRVAAGKLIPANSKITPNASQNVSVNINDMHLHGVQDPDGFASAIEKELPGIVKQRLFKNK